MSMLALALTVTLLGADDLEALNTPPPGFIALFNGKDLSHWRQDENDAKTHWTVKDGILHYDGKGNSLRTAKDYGDVEMYVDWKISAKSDSGIYLRGKPQVQIWDNPIGSGGLYNNKTHPDKPTAVADKPIGEWNTFHILIKGDKVTVDLNGKRVVDNVTMESYPKYDAPLPATGTIELQHHGNPLMFRNIYLKEL
ncbi:MAG: DUF1080 domain-containing protein [Isosphaeraceae bacterium]